MARQSTASLRARSHVDFVHVLLIQGLDTIWTDDASGVTWGSALSGLTTRTCKPGLEVPPIQLGVSFRSGWLENNTVAFTLQDQDDVVAQVFAADPDADDVRILAATVLPTTDPLGNVQVQGAGTNDSISSWGKHIGVERIGPAGERNHFSPFNFALPPLYHPVDRSPDAGGVNVLVSDEPHIFEGRLVALYRFFRDPDVDGVAAYGSFAEADRAWWGVMRDRAEVTGDKVWRISCYGPEGLQKRQLNGVTRSFAAEGSSSNAWRPITAKVQLGTDERKVGVLISDWTLVGGPTTVLYPSSFFHASATLSASATPQELAAEVDDIVQDIASLGAASSYITHDPSGASLPTGYQAGGTWYDVNDDSGRNSIRVRRGRISIQTTVDDSHPHNAQVDLVLHEKVWRSWGWDLEGQSAPLYYSAGPAETRAGTSQATRDETHQVFFGRFDHEAFDLLGVWSAIASNPEPTSDGYFVGRFWTRGLGTAEAYGQDAPLDNNGIVRSYSPAVESAVSLLEMSDGFRQEITLGQDSAFIEGQTMPDEPGVSQVGGSTVDRLRYWAVKGRILRPGATEKEDLIQVAQVSWVDDDGLIGENSDGSAALVIERWEDPRAFGFPYEQERGLAIWASPVTGGHVVAPLATLSGYLGNAADFRYRLWLQVMHATGTASWAAGVLTFGVNNPDATLSGGAITQWPVDIEIASLGLGIPKDLIESPPAILDAYQAAMKGVGSEESALNRVNLAWIGPQNSEQLLDTLTTPVGLAARLHGAKYGLFALYQTPSQEDVDLVIDQEDLGSIDPPSHGRRLDGQYQSVRLRYRQHPDGLEPVESRTDQARDPHARSRPGNLPFEVTDLGLLPQDYFPRGDMWAAAGAQPWIREWVQLWTVVIPGFYAERNFTVQNLQISRPKGQDVWPGTLLRLTNPWPAHPHSGAYGLTNALARVLRVRKEPDGAVDCEVLIYGGSLRGPQGQGVYYAPCVRLAGYDSATRRLRYLPNWRGGSSTIDDTLGLVKPSWASGSGQMKLQLYRWSRRGWSTGPTGFVESVDTASGNITIASPGLTGTYLRDSDYLGIPAPYDDPEQADWVKGIYGVITRDDGTFGASNTRAPKYVDS